MNMLDKATDPLQYDSIDIDWQKEGMADSPTRIFYVECLTRELEDLTRKSVIDIGSGTGHLTELLLERGAKTIYGVEPSKKNTAVSRKLYPQMHVIESSLENAQINTTFDVAIAMMVFEHIHDLNIAFGKINKLLKPNGTLYTVIGDKKYFTTERFDYNLKIEDIGNHESVVAAHRYFGLMHDIARPVSNYINAARKSNFKLLKRAPFVPTDRLMQIAPKYKQFKGKPLSHILILKKISGRHKISS